MGIPEVIFICIECLGLGIMLVKHGQMRDDKYNIWSQLISAAVMTGLLFWGGFFN
jgi:hypothetical protein